MVALKQRFLIDSTFIFENTHKSFLGAALFKLQGQDRTFLFGFLRDFLRLRHSVGINSGLIGIGKEVYAVTERENIHDIVNLLTEIGIPHVFDPNNKISEICAALSQQISNIVTQNKKLLQFANDDILFTFPNNLKEIHYMNPKIIKSKIGVEPKHIPTFLSLTEGAKSSNLTRLQAIRLIELYSDIDGIYENLSNISAVIKKKLNINEKSIISYYSEMKIKKKVTSTSYNIDNFAINLNNKRNRDLLNSYGFYSLTRLLKSPPKITPKLNAKEQKDKNSYRAIVDAKGLKELETLLDSSEFCSIDTEADDKDPHDAIILGVSFSVKKGEAFFVPLMEDDLKDIKQKDVISFLKRIAKKPIKFIGHNFKYDYLLLRMNGIKIRNIHFDTMLAAYECFGDWTFFNLKYLAYKLLGKEIKSYKEIVDKGKTFFDLPFKKIVNHACEDADITLQVYHSLFKELEKREIIDQYFCDTLPMMKKLGDMEFIGVSVRFEKLVAFRKRLLNRSLKLRKNIFNKIGKEFDIDSQRDLSAVINDTLNLQEFVRSRKITPSVLEQLAVNNPIAKLIVKYKRLQKRMKNVDAIVKSIKGKKIYPTFNQIKTSYGQISSTGPNIFDNEGSDNLKNCFSKSLMPYFRDTKSSMDILQKLSHDHNFKKDRAKKKKEFMAAHPQMKEIKKDEFLLAALIGYSDAKLSQKFMIDRLTLSTLRHELEMRYSTLFHWIEDFKTRSAKGGYAKLGNKRKYLDGLKSSNLEKRKKAINLSVRWLIQY